MMSFTPRLRERKMQLQQKQQQEQQQQEADDAKGRPPIPQHSPPDGPSHVRNASTGSTLDDEDEELVDDLKMKISTLDMQVKLAKEEISNRDSRIQSLERRARRLEEKLVKAQAEATCAEEAMAEEAASASMMKDLEEELERTKRDMGGQLRKLEIRCEELRSDRDEARKELETTREEFSETTRREIQEQKTELLTKLQEAEQRAEDVRASSTEEIRKTKEELHHAEGALSERQNEVGRLKERCRNLEQQRQEEVSQQEDLHQATQKHAEELEQRLAEQSVELTEVKADMEERQDSIRRLEQRCQVLEKEKRDVVASVAKQGASASEKEASLAEALGKAESELAVARGELQNRDDEIARLHEDTKRLERDVKDNRREHDQIVSDLRSCQAAVTEMLQTSEDEVERLKQEVVDREERIANTETKMTQLADSAAEEREKLEKLLDVFREENSSMETRLKTLEVELDKTKQDARSQAEQAQNLQEQCVQLEKEKDLIRTEVAGAAAAKLEEQARAEKEKLDKIVRELQTNNARLNEKLGDAEADLERAKLDARSKGESVQRLEQRCARTEKENERIKAEISGGNATRIEELEAHNFTLTERLKVTETDNDMLEMEVQTLKEKNASLEEKVDEYHISSDLLDEYESAKHDLVEEVDHLEEKCRRLEDKLKEVYESKDASRELMRDLEDKNRSLAEQLEEAKEKLDLVEKDGALSHGNNRLVGAATNVEGEDDDHFHWNDRSPELFQDIQSTFTLLSDVVKQAEKESSVFESEVQCLKRKCMTLEGKLTKAQRTIDELHNLRGSKESLSKEVMEAEKERKILENQVQYLEQTCRSFEEQISQVARQHESDGKAVAKMKGTAVDIDDMDSLEEIMDGQEGDNQHLVEELKHTQQELQQVEEELEQFKKKYETLQAENTSDLVDELLTSNAELTEKMQTMSRESKAWQNEVQFLQRKCAGLEEKLASGGSGRTANNVKHLVSEKNALEEQVRTLAQKCHDLEEKLNQHASPRAVADLPVSSTSDNGSGSQPQPQHQRTGSSGVPQQVKWQKYTQSVAKLASRTVQFQLHLDDTKSKVLALQKDVASKKKNYRGETSMTLVKPAQRLQKLAIRNDQLQSELDEARSGVDALQKEASVSSFDNEDAATTLFERTQALKKLASQHKQLHVELVKARSRVVTLQKEIATTAKRFAATDAAAMGGRAEAFSQIPSQIQIVMDEETPQTPVRRAASPTFDDWEI